MPKLDTVSRQQLLTTLSNPDESIDYLIKLENQIEKSLWINPRTNELNLVTIDITYVPDRWILHDSSLSNYLRVLYKEPAETIEHAGLLILNDFNNQLVPRWISLKVIAFLTIDGVKQTKKICFQDQQPNWNNSSLIGVSDKE